MGRKILRKELDQRKIYLEVGDDSGRDVTEDYIQSIDDDTVDEMPWYSRKPEEGEKVTGKVKRLMPHGAWIELQNFGGWVGFLHVGEISNHFISDITDHLRPGQYVEAVVIKPRSHGSRDLCLSMKTDRDRPQNKEINYTGATDRNLLAEKIRILQGRLDVIEYVLHQL